MAFSEEMARTIKLEWIGDYPGPEVEEMVRSDIAHSLRSMKAPSSLITHNVFLGDDLDGPSVSVWGEEGRDDALWCQYQEKTIWVDAAGANCP